MINEKSSAEQSNEIKQLQELFTAVKEGNLEVVKYLVEKQKVPINKASIYGTTPVYAAAQDGHLDIVKYLIAKGADVNQATIVGFKMLHAAAQMGHLEVVKYLVANGANVNQATTRHGVTPLHIAAQNGKLEVVKFLLEQQRAAAVYHPSSTGKTALHLAILNKHEAVIKQLIIAGAMAEQESQTLKPLLLYSEEASTTITAFKSAPETMKAKLEEWHQQRMFLANEFRLNNSPKTFFSREQQNTNGYSTLRFFAYPHKPLADIDIVFAAEAISTPNLN